MHIIKRTSNFQGFFLSIRFADSIDSFKHVSIWFSAFIINRTVYIWQNIWKYIYDQSLTNRFTYRYHMLKAGYPVTAPCISCVGYRKARFPCRIWIWKESATGQRRKQNGKQQTVLKPKVKTWYYCRRN